MNNDDSIVLAGYSNDDILSSDWQNSILSTTLNTNTNTNTSTSSSVISASIIAGAGIAGAGLITSTTGSPQWYGGTPSAVATPYTISNSNYTQQVLKVAGNAEFEGDIKIKGVNLSERLDAIEQRLGILRPNNDLEGKWEKLKALGEEYRNLEKEILEGESVWDILKK